MGHFVTRIGLRVGAPDGRKQNSVADQREDHAKLGDSHEVTAARAGRFVPGADAWR
jgi:hypothetical protein